MSLVSSYIHTYKMKWKNFKNLPKSMAAKHQKWMCHQMLSVTDAPTENYLYEGDVVQRGQEKSIDQLPPDHRQCLQDKFPDVTVTYVTEGVTIRGSTFKVGCVLTLGYDDDSFPLFGWLDEIYIVEQVKYFLVKIVTISGYLDAINAYEIEVSAQLRLVQYRDLFQTLPLCIHYFKNRPCIIDKYGFQSHLV